MDTSFHIIELPCGGSIELLFEYTETYVRGSGDGWNEPREPAHWEFDDTRVVYAYFRHLDGDCTGIDLHDEGSIMQRFFQAMLDRVQVDELAESIAA